MGLRDGSSGRTRGQLCAGIVIVDVGGSSQVSGGRKVGLRHQPQNTIVIEKGDGSIGKHGTEGN